MKTLYLYTAVGCHLCDKAKDIVWPLLDRHGYRLQSVDIGSDQALQSRYGTRIPVVRRDDRSEELGWPFSAGQLSRYLAAD